MDQMTSSPQLREYLVIVNSYQDLESFRQDIENPGGNLYIPEREVKLFANLHNSLVTGYLLSDQEALQVRQDPRVKSVHLSYKAKGLSLKPSYTQNSIRWSKLTTLNSLDKNWGLLRTHIANNYTNWATNGTPIVSATLNAPIEGSNVDLVIVDTAIQDFMHPEFWKPTSRWANPSVPETRAQQFNWLPYALSVLGTNSSQTTIKVKTLGNDYFYLDNELYGNAQENPTIWLVAGWEYNFQVTTPGNPFAIKTALGIGENDLKGDILGNVTENGTVIFPPDYSGPTRLYYQSTTNPGMYGVIEIVNSYTYNTWVYRPNENLDHGISVAGIAGGSQHGFARLSNIYSIEAYESPMNIIGNLYNALAVIRAWHNSKPLITSLGVRKHTVVNLSLGLSIKVLYSQITSINYRGNTFSGVFTISGQGSTPWSEMGFAIYGENRDDTGIFINGYDTALSTIIQECINDGIIFCLAAGNDATTIERPGGKDADNSVQFTIGSSPYTFYTNHRGLGSNNDSLVVAALGALNTPETLASFTNRGPGIDIVAPGELTRTSVYASNPASVTDSRNVNYRFGIFNGTSAASAHVAGVVANLLEIFPSADQDKINSVIKNIAQRNQITGTETTSSVTALRGTPNLLLHYPVLSFKVQPDRLSVSEREIVNFRIETTNLPDNSVLYFGIGGDLESDYILGGIGYRRITIFNNEALVTLTTNIEELVPGKYFYAFLIAGDTARPNAPELARSDNVLFEPRSSDLPSLDFGELSEWFNPDIYEYYLEYNNDTEYTSFLIDFFDPACIAKIEYLNPDTGLLTTSTINKYTFTEPIFLQENLYELSLVNQFTNTNIVKIYVDSPALTTSTYTFYIEKYGNANNQLADLQVLDVELDPLFAPETYEYNAYVPSSTSSVAVLADAVLTTTQVTINGSMYTGTPITVPLIEGSNSIPILVTNLWNKDLNRDITRGYTVNVFKNLPGFTNDARLSSITILNLPFTFNKDVYNYNISAPFTLDTAQVQVTSNARASRIEIQNEVYVENTSTTSTVFLITNQYKTIPLTVGLNNVIIEVLAQDNITTITYTLSIRREGDISTDLADIQVSSGFLSPYFNPNINNYQVDVPFEITSIKLRMIEAKPIYIKYVNNVRVLDDRWSQDVSLNTGTNVITVNVVAQNRTTDEQYYVKVIRGSKPNPVVTATSNMVPLNKPIWTTLTENLGVATEGTSASFTVHASNTASYNLIAGKLPVGLTLNTGTGIISGTVSNLYDDNTYKFVLRAKNNFGINDKTFSISVIGKSAPIVSTKGGLLRIGPSNEFYIVNGMYANYQFSASTDILPTGRNLTFFIADGDGELPRGLNLSSTGLIYGQVEESLREVDQTSGKDAYDKYKYDMQPYDFETLFGIGSSGRYVNKLYNFTVSVSNGISITKSDFQIQVYDPIYLYSKGSANEYPIPPQWMIASDLGEYKSNSYLTIKLDVHDPDPGAGTITYQYIETPTQKLPPGIVLDTDNGVLSGWLDYTPQYKTEYSFIFRVFKNNIVLGSNSYRQKTFNLTVLGAKNNNLEFVTPNYLGELEQGQQCEIDFVVKSEQSFTVLYFSLLTGSLPPGLILTTDGHLQGYIPYNTGITNDATYTFSIKARDNNYGYEISRLFTILIKGYSGTKYATLTLKPLLSDNEKSIYYKYIENPDIFNEEYIYRPNDPAFGIQREMKFILNPAIESIPASDSRYNEFVAEIQKYFYRKRLYFKDYTKLVANDKYNDIAYEVVCCELFDEYQRDYGSIAKELETSYGIIYPNSINNLISALEKYAKINYKIFPRFMQTIQNSLGLQFRSKVFMIICFCKPGYADIVIEKMKTNNMNLNMINFDVERLQFNNSLTPSQYKYLLFPIRKPLL